MSETTNLKLFKHDNPETNKNLFDVTKSLNENWDKIDEYVYGQEAGRQANEQTRQTNETTRQNQEEIRETNEATRQLQETDRISNEEQRNSEEEIRKANELQRISQEDEREEYITNLKERVNNGEFKGDPNVLKIGTVEKGEEASATIEGDSPNQTLNLVLPKGDKGNKGDKGDKGEQGEVSVDQMNKAIETAISSIPTILGNTLTIPIDSWIKNEETQYYEFDVKDETVTSDTKIIGDLDIDNQNKINSRGYANSYNGGYKIILTDKPLDTIVIQITKIKVQVN